MELEINKKFIIKSKSSGDIILSKFAIEKDFILSEDYQKQKQSNNFASAFRKKIKEFLK